MELARGLWRLPLASATLPPFDHTNLYLVCDGGEAVLVDPGGEGEAALAALGAVLARAGTPRLTAVLLTHSHPDHVAGLRALRIAFGALPVMVHPAEASRLPAGLALLPVAPLRVGSLWLEPLHTPGHSPGHLSFYLPERAAALVGDLLAGEGTTWVGVPEGDMNAYLASLERLASLPLELAGPGHGPPLSAPRAKALEVRRHRLAREAQLLELLKDGAQTARALGARVYPVLPSESLRDLAERTLLAHLAKLVAEGRVRHDGRGLADGQGLAEACFELA